MNVGQLIDALTGLPSDKPVVISGYEGGLTEVVGVEPAQVFPNVNRQPYYGEHEPDREFGRRITGVEPVGMIQIIGKRH